MRSERYVFTKRIPGNSGRHLTQKSQTSCLKNNSFPDSIIPFEYSAHCTYYYKGKKAFCQYAQRFLQFVKTDFSCVSRETKNKTSHTNKCFTWNKTPNLTHQQMFHVKQKAKSHTPTNVSRGTKRPTRQSCFAPTRKATSIPVTKQYCFT